MKYYITAHDKPEDLSELYEEWTGKKPQFKVPLTNTLLIVARGEDKILGAAMLIIIYDPFWDRKWGLVENLYVRKGYRRQGIARKLMEHIETTALGFECEFIKLTSVKKVAQKLYHSLGYEEGMSFKKYT